MERTESEREEEKGSRVGEKVLSLNNQVKQPAQDNLLYIIWSLILVTHNREINCFIFLCPRYFAETLVSSKYLGNSQQYHL